MVEPVSRGVLDAPLSRGMTAWVYSAFKSSGRGIEMML
jgi:hypothetical protein